MMKKTNLKETLKQIVGVLLFGYVCIAEAVSTGCKKLRTLPKKVMALCVAAALIVAMVPAYVFAAETTYDIWVGGVQFTGTNLVIDGEDVTGITGSATFNPETKTLTLNNFSYTGEGYNYSSNVGALIYSQDIDLKIVLKGTNTLAGADRYQEGIIIENGSLTIANSDADDVMGSLKLTAGYPVICVVDGSLFVENVNLTVINTLSPTGNPGEAILVTGDISITHSDVTAISGDSDGDDIPEEGATFGILTMGSISVTNSIVSATGYYGGMWANSLSVTNSIVTAAGNLLAIADINTEEGLVPTITGDHVVYAGNDAASAAEADASAAATYANKYVKIEPVKYDLYIGGVQFTSGNLIIDSTDSTAISGSATYNPELNTLILNNFQYSGPGYKNDEYEYLYGALRVEGDNDLRIVFTGQNVIECTNGDERWGLYTDFIGDLHIKAETIDSSLTFIGGDVACGRVPVFDGNFVIYAGDNEADAKITAEDTFASQYYTYSYVRYEPTLMVTFDYGTLGKETKMVLRGETVTPPAPVFAGKVLVGWYTDSSFYTEFNFSDAIYADKTIYAKFADYEDDKAALQDAIDALEADVTQLNMLTKNGGTIDQINAKIAAIESQVAALDALKNKYAEADTALKQELQQELQAADTVINNAITALTGRVETLESELNTAKNNISTNASNVAQLTADLAGLNASLTDLSSKLTNEYATKAELTITIDSAKATIQQAIDALTTRVQTLEAGLAEANSKIDTNTSDVGVLKSDVAVLKNWKTEAENIINGLKTLTETQGTDITKLKVAVQDLEADLAAANAKIKDLEGRIEALEGKVSALETAKQNLDAAVAALNAAINNKADTATLNQKVSELNAAIVAAEAAAKAYADGKDNALKTELTTAIATAKGEAITAAENLVNTAKAELQTAINNKADIATLNAKVAELNAAIAIAEATAKAYTDSAVTTLNAAIITAKDEAVDAAKDLVDAAKAQLQAAIDNKADTAAVNAAIANLQNAITALQNAKDNYIAADAALKAELEDAIAKAKQEAIDAAKGHIPYIGTNGNWWIGDTDTGVSANGIKGDKGDKGDTGADGVGIAKIEKTATNGNVDTYTVTLTNGKTYTFTVTNGKDGTDGKDGENGKDGLTPFIGENGNWWIGDTDTGVKAVADDSVPVGSGNVTEAEGVNTVTVVAIVIAGVALLGNVLLAVLVLKKKKSLV